jgi:hypothetical protein
MPPRALVGRASTTDAQFPGEGQARKNHPPSHDEATTARGLSPVFAGRGIVRRQTLSLVC